jgi:hypothetical protein
VDDASVIGRDEADEPRDDDLIVPIDKGPGKGEGAINVSLVMRRAARAEAQLGGAVEALRQLAEAGDVLPVAASQASDATLERWVRALRNAHSIIGGQ